ncbi:MAG: ribosome biogenesis protein [Nanoarchaeota archaeon]
MLLKKCSNKSCNTYTFKEKCPECNSNTLDSGYKFRERFLKNENIDEYGKR